MNVENVQQPFVLHRIEDDQVRFPAHLCVVLGVRHKLIRCRHGQKNASGSSIQRLTGVIGLRF